MNEENEAYTEVNRNMWNHTAEVHAKVTLEGLLARVRAPDFSTFDAVEQAIFAQLGLEGKAVAQPSCNNGRELISVKKAGAGRCVGFDISDKFIAQGQQLAEAGSVNVEFVRTSVYDIPREYDGQFDLVYVTIGALGWLPGTEVYFGVISRLLKPGGDLFLYEMHPVLDMFDPDKGLEVVTSYFTTEPTWKTNLPTITTPRKPSRRPRTGFTTSSRTLSAARFAAGSRSPRLKSTRTTSRGRSGPSKRLKRSRPCRTRSQRRRLSGAVVL